MTKTKMVLEIRNAREKFFADMSRRKHQKRVGASYASWAGRIDSPGPKKKKKIKKIAHCPEGIRGYF